MAERNGRQQPESEMSMAELVEAIEHAQFSCEGGGLGMFIPWQELKRRLAETGDA
jgi:hypothetical protein